MANLRGRETDGLGVVTEYYTESDKTVVKRVQDVESILERNKREFNAYEPRSTRWGKEPMRRYASIPNVTVEKFMTEGLNIFNKEDVPRIMRKLQSPEYKYLRCMPGKF